mgnify:CR=1 FL=1
MQVPTTIVTESAIEFLTGVDSDLLILILTGVVMTYWSSSDGNRSVSFPANFYIKDIRGKMCSFMSEQHEQKTSNRLSTVFRNTFHRYITVSVMPQILSDMFKTCS